MGKKEGNLKAPTTPIDTRTHRERERPFAFEFFWWNNFPEVCSSTRNNKWEEPSSTGTKRKRWNTPGSITSPTATKVSLMTSYLTFGNISILITIKLRFGKIVWKIFIKYGKITKITWNIFREFRWIFLNFFEFFEFLKTISR